MEPSVRVLVVDDDPEILRMLVLLLEMEGYSVKGSSDGFLGLHTYWEFRPHIMIVDIEMPHMDGVELIRQIREQDEEIRFVILSGWDSSKRAADTQSLDISDYLLKPTSPSEIINSLRKIRAGILVRLAAQQAEQVLQEYSETERINRERFEMWQRRQAELLQAEVEEQRRRKLEAEERRLYRERQKNLQEWGKWGLVVLAVIILLWLFRDRLG